MTKKELASIRDNFPVHNPYKDAKIMNWWEQLCTIFNVLFYASKDYSEAYNAYEDGYYKAFQIVQFHCPEYYMIKDRLQESINSKKKPSKKKKS